MVYDPYMRVLSFSLTKGIGRLNLSRALGDFDLKKNLSLGPEKQIITADPDVTVHDIAKEDEFLVLACDGTLLSIVP
jgi:serine/threonine protein phosphatase PrpC